MLVNIIKIKHDFVLAITEKNIYEENKIKLVKLSTPQN